MDERQQWYAKIAGVDTLPRINAKIKQYRDALESEYETLETFTGSKADLALIQDNVELLHTALEHLLTLRESKQ